MYANPWVHVADAADILARVADAVSWVYPQANLIELGLKVAGLMLRHPAFNQPYPHLYFGR